MPAWVTLAGRRNVLLMFAGAGRNRDLALGEHPPFSTTITSTIFTSSLPLLTYISALDTCMNSHYIHSFFILWTVRA